MEIKLPPAAALFPEWLTPLTPFIDSGGDLNVFLGVGGWRSCTDVPLIAGNVEIGQVAKLVFNPAKALCACRYKGAWFFREVDLEVLGSVMPYTGDPLHCWDPPYHGTDVSPTE